MKLHYNNNSSRSEPPFGEDMRTIKLNREENSTDTSVQPGDMRVQFFPPDCHKYLISKLKRPLFFLL